MTIIKSRRGRLDSALAKVAIDILLLAGGAGSDAEKVYRVSRNKITESFRRTILITDLNVLTRAERGKWFSRAGRFAMLSGGSTARKSVVARGRVSKFVLSTGRVSTIELRNTFSEAGGNS